MGWLEPSTVSLYLPGAAGINSYPSSPPTGALQWAPVSFKTPLAKVIRWRITTERLESNFVGHGYRDMAVNCYTKWNTWRRGTGQVRGPQCLWEKNGNNAKTLLRTHLETLQMADPDFEVSDVNYFRSKFSGHRLQVAYSANCWRQMKILLIKCRAESLKKDFCICFPKNWQINTGLFFSSVFCFFFWFLNTHTNARACMQLFICSISKRCANTWGCSYDGKLQISDDTPLPFNPTNANIQTGFNTSYIMTFKETVCPSKSFSSDFLLRYNMYLLSV